MIKFDYSQNNYSDLIKHYAKVFGTKAVDNTVLLPEEIGSGSIKIHVLANGLQIFISDYLLKEDMLLTRKKNNKDFFLLRFEEMTVNSGGRYFSKSAVILSGTNNDHLFLQTAGTHVKVFALLFERNWLRNFFTKEQGEEMLKYLSVNMGTFIYEQIDAEYKLMIKEAISNEDKRFDPFIIKNRSMLLLERFFSRLYLKITDANFSLQISADDIAVLKKVESEMISDFSVSPDIKKLSRMAAMSATKFTRSFRQMFGIPVYQYFQKHRMNKAKAMLLSGKYAPKDVSNELGFANFSSFAKSFHKTFDQSPLQFAHKQ